MLIVTEDGPLALDRLRLVVKAADGTTLRESDLRLPEEASLPTTLAIASNGDPTAAVRITVAGFRGGVPFDRRDNVVEQVPTDRVGALTVVLSARCTSKVVADGNDARSTCAEGETCDPKSGSCVSDRIDGRALPTYAAGDEARDAAVGGDDATLIDPGDASGDAATSPDSGPTVCGPTEKRCGAACVSRLDPAFGCSSATCTPCSLDTNAVFTCDATQACAFSACAAGYKPCAGKCVAITDPTYGCGATTCDLAACPDAGSGTLVCQGTTCAIGACGAGTKPCGNFCVPTDRNNGCQAASCASCTTKETCQGTPSACACAPDRLTPCTGKDCGPATDTCGVPFTCNDSCPGRGLVCGGGGATANKCGCVAQPPEVTCAGKACGPATDNCGQSVLCPNTCAPGEACGVGGINSCGAPPSCVAAGSTQGLTTCGPAGDQNCCDHALVPGGSFLGSDDKFLPATISPFRLDLYEVTVGRFRNFATAWAGGWRPQAGVGKHTHLNGGQGVVHATGGFEGGWNSSWDAGIGNFNTDLLPGSSTSTWTVSSGAGDVRALNRITFREAFAFCIWDGGFLPTAFEWNFAATAGSEQRLYPWGSTGPSDGQVVYCPGGSCAGTKPVTPGTKPAGAAAWGHLDMAGNVGEWGLGQLTAGVPSCIDCVGLIPADTNTGYLGGSFLANTSQIDTKTGSSLGDTFRSDRIGARCARLP